MHIRKHQKGFTLVELIVVMTILSLMAGIIVPQLLGHVDKARMDAEYDAGENCRLAAQLKLNALESFDILPDRDIDNIKLDENSPACVQWSVDFSKDIIAMSGVDVNLLYIGVGQYCYYKGTSDVSPAYKVYYIAYQREADSPVIFYDGESWSTECPWHISNYSAVPSLTVNGSLKKIQFLCLAAAGDYGDVFEGLEAADAE